MTTATKKYDPYTNAGPRHGRALWAPRKRYPMQEWCDAHLYLDPRTANIAGPWDTMTFAPQRGIMYLWEHPVVRELNLCWGAQGGKTVMTLACIAHAGGNAPAPGFLCGPDEVFMKKFFRDKLYPTLELCKQTRDLLLNKRWQAFPTLDLGEMLVHGAWSGSATRMGDVSARYGFYLELDKWDDSISREADPEYLAGERHKTWPNYKVLKEGTPTDETSRIARNLAEADVVLKYHVPCPHCGKFQILKMGKKEGKGGGLKWDHDKEGKSTPALARETARYECEKCGETIFDHHRRAMFRAGVWAPEGHDIPRDCKSLVLWGKGGPKRKVGTQLSSLYSPLVTWGDIAEKFILAQKTPAALQDFINGWLAEIFKFNVDVPDWKKFSRLHARPEPRAVVPDWARVIVAGCDVHKYKNHFVVMAWGPGPMAQIILTGIIDEPVHSELGRVEAMLDTILAGPFHKANGAEMTVRLCLVDSGYNTGEVYRVCDRWGARALPLREVPRRAGIPAPIQLSTREKSKFYGRARGGRALRPRGGRGLLLVDGDYWAAELNGMMQRNPEDPGSLWLHAEPVEDYVRGLCNVYPALQKDNRGREKIVWKVDDDEYKDHDHDATAYGLVAAQRLGIRFMKADAPPPARRASPPGEGRVQPTKVEPGGRAMTFREMERR